MCCFSQPVISVNATNIFARAGDNDRQFLAYSMTLNAKSELAMVLPLPVKPGTDEKGVKFIDLSAYPNFFADLLKGFPTPKPKASFGWGLSRSAPAAAQPLAVVKVGSFEASFVPSLKDFSRLDERFRIRDEAWRKLPQYADFGFAVFKLKSGEARIHPMAFSFPRRDPRKLFFPTVHIHDGEVHEQAEFDHLLYCQPNEDQSLALQGWRESERLANSFMNINKTQGLMAARQHCYQKIVRGMLRNRDTLVSIAA